jgi:hypothetical protein
VRFAWLLLVAACARPAPAPPPPPPNIAEPPTREACVERIVTAMKEKGGDFAALPEPDREEMIGDCQREGSL